MVSNLGAIFSDLHGHSWGEFAATMVYRRQAVNSRLADSAKVIDHVCRYVEEHGIRYVFFAGDLFHRRRLIDVATFNIISSALWRLAKRVDTLYLLAGNHDLVRRSALSFSDEHALIALSKYRNVRVIDRPTVVLDGVAMVPYNEDRETLLRGIEEVTSGSAHCLILHAGVSGAKTGAMEYKPLEPVTLGDLPNHLPIYSGHYHAPQTLGASFEYVGAPLEFVRGEGKAKRRGFATFDLANPGSLQRVTHKGPRFVTLAAGDKNLDAASGNFVDLVVSDVGLAVEPLVAELRDRGARGVNVVWDVPAKTKASRLKVGKRKGKLPSIGELCEAVVDASDTKLDKRKLKDIAREALQEAEAASGD